MSATPPAEYTKPVPRPLNPELSQPFWEAAQRHHLVLPRCTRCGRYHFYPREVCPYCFSPNLEWVPASGRGRLYTYTVIHQPENRAFQADVPYAHCVVRLDEGVMMMSNVVGCRIPDDLRVDMPLEAVFDDVTAEWTLVKFKPAGAA
jgi:uncharacterized OB-fold protein